MGSARMGVARQASAVDANGEAWDVQNLFVADAALMPTSTGDHPLSNQGMLGSILWH